MQYGVVLEELAVEVMAQLPNDRARKEVMALVEVARMDPRAWPDVRDVGSVEESREAFGRRCWIQYMPQAGAIEVRDIGSGWTDLAALSSARTVSVDAVPRTGDGAGRRG